MLRNDYTKFSNRQTVTKIERVQDDVIETEPKHGIVTDCATLNVRKEPNPTAEVVCTITCSTDLVIDENESTDKFYKICTAAGIEGFCMRRYITLMP